MAPAHVAGPTTLAWRPNQLMPGSHVADQLVQFLVNRKTEQAFALADRDEAGARRIELWFDDLWRKVGRLLDEPDLKVTFERRVFNFVFTRRDGHSFDLRTLADGHAAVLSILAEILLRIDASESSRAATDPSDGQPSGVVIIDELETHLHLKLQEDILPFLTSVFPRLQFIIATHSPIVIASIPGALVFDLAKRASARSEEFRGVRYGALMTGHFGIPDDIDLDSIEKLREMRSLASKERNEDEEIQLQIVASELARRSASMALEVWIATDGRAGAREPRS